MLVELVRLSRQSESDKDLQILLLHRQKQAPRFSLRDKALGTKLRSRTGRTIKAMGEMIRILKPATLFSWHQQMVRLKWTYRRRKPGGRPRRHHHDYYHDAA